MAIRMIDRDGNTIKQFTGNSVQAVRKFLYMYTAVKEQALDGTYKFERYNGRKELVDG